MKWLVSALSGILGLELILSYVCVGTPAPLLFGLGAVGLLLLCALVFPRVVHLVSFILSAFLLGIWWNALMDLGHFGWPLAAAMAMHFYALGIGIAQILHPDDQRLRSDTHWVFGLSFAMAFLPAYLLFADTNSELLPVWTGRVMAGALLACNFLLLEFSRLVNQSKPWLRTPSSLMRSGLFLVLLGTLLSTSYLAASFVSGAMPDAVMWVRDTVDSLRDRLRSNDNPIDAAANALNPDALNRWLQSRDDQGVALGRGPSQDGREQEVLIVDFLDDGTLNEMSRRQVYVQSRVDDFFEGAQWRNTQPRKNLSLTDSNQDGFVRVSPHLVGYPPVAHQVSVTEPGRTVHALAGLRDIEASVVRRMDEGWYQFTGTPPGSYAAHSQMMDYVDVRNEPLMAGEVDPRFLQLPNTDLMRRISQIRRNLPLRGRGVNAHIDACLRYLDANYEYSLRVENPEGREWLENFVLHERRGYCTYYATLLALMLRDAQIPARVTAGFSGGELRPGTNWVVFQQKHAHAWTEVHTDKYGWIIVDATPATDELGTPSTPRAEPPDSEPDVAQAGAGEASWSPPRHFLAALLVVGCTVLLLGLLCVRLLAPRPASSKPLVKPTPDYFKAFCRKFEKSGFPRRPGQTPREYLRILQAEGLAGAEFEPMIGYYYQVMYRDGNRSPEQERDFARLIRRHRPPIAS